MVSKSVIFLLLFSFVHLANSHLFELIYGNGKCKSRKGKFPKPGSFCRSYYECNNWRPKELTCPEDQHFFPAGGYCVWQDEYPCLEKPTSKECPLPKGKFLKPGSNCKKYYDCCNGVPTEKTCSSRLLFDEERGKCDWEELVTCTEDVTTLKSTPQVTFTPTPLVTRTVSTAEETSVSTISPTPPRISTTVSTTEEARVSTISPTPPRISTTTVSPTEETRVSTISPTPPRISTTTVSPTEETGGSTISPFPPRISTSVSEKDSSDESGSSEEGDSSEEDKVSTPTFRFKSTPPNTPTFSSSSFDEFSSTKDSSTPVFPFTGDFKKSSVSDDSTNTPEYLTSSTESSSSVGNNLITGSSTSELEDISTISERPKVSFSDEFDTKTPTYPDITSVETTTLVTGTDKNIEDFSSTLISNIPETTSESTETVNKKDDFSTTTDYTDSTIVYETTAEATKEGRDKVLSTTTSSFTDSVTGGIFCPKPNGYFPHPTNKHKFIACVGGNPIEMDCYGDLVYNHKKRSCEYE